MKIPQEISIKFTLILISLVAIISFGQVLKFDIWQDDNALIFKAQHPQEQAGVFGPGVFGLGAYRYVAAPYIFLYQLFGLNLPVFYLIAIIFYVLAAISVFFLAIELYFGNKLLSALAGLIFAAGFIGSDGVLRLFNSLQTSYSIILVSLLFVILRRFLVSKKFFFYFLSIPLFYLIVETSLIRTQYLIVPVIVFVLLFLINRKSIKATFLALILNIPYLAIFYKQYLETPDPRNQLIPVFFQGLLSSQIEYLFSFFGSIGNLFIPNILVGKLFLLSSVLSKDVNNQLLFLVTLLLICFIILALALIKKEMTTVKFGVVLIFVGWFLMQFIFWESELLQRHPAQVMTQMVLSNFTGGSLLIIFLILIFKLWIKKSNAGLLALFLLSWMGSNILTFSIYLPFDPLETISRYLTHSLVPFAIFIPLVALQNSRTLAIIISGLIIIVNLLLATNYQSNFIKEKTIPTKKFYHQLKSFVLKINKGSILYFDVSNDPLAKEQFKDFFSVGSMPDSTAIAVRYEIDRYDIKIAKDFNELKDLIIKSNADLENVFSFFYKPNELINTTQGLRDNLTKGQYSQLINPGKQETLTSIEYLGANSTLYLNPILTKDNINFSLISPAKLEITAKASLKSYVQKFPFRDMTALYHGGDIQDLFKGNDTSCTSNLSIQKVDIFRYLISKKNFYDKVKVEVDSEEKGLGKDNLVDNDKNSIWRGKRGKWHFDKRESVTIDLGEERKISGVNWKNAYANSTPTIYKLEVASDKINWQLVKKVKLEQKIDPESEIPERFTPTVARFVRLVIDQTYDGDSPGLSEIEVMDASFEDVNKLDSEKLSKQPFTCIGDQAELATTIDFVKSQGISVPLSWKTDKETKWEPKNTHIVNLIPDGQLHTYEILLPAGGINLESILVGPASAPSEIEINRFDIESVKLGEIPNLLSRGKSI